MTRNLYKFGRKARTSDPRIPHFSALKYSFGSSQIQLPDVLNYTEAMDPNFGMMLNDELGDCTCAAFYHARQLWSFHSGGKEITEPDRDVQALYTAAAGYNPNGPFDIHGKNKTDKGANEQALLSYIHKKGAPTGPDGRDNDKIPAFAEVDPHNIQDIKRTIYDCGVAYIGFIVPLSWTTSPAPELWDYIQGDTNSDDGHAVVLTGWDQEGFNLISWGQSYKMTYRFLNEFVDEAYAITDDLWTQKTGKSLLSMSTDQLKASMMAF